MDEIRDTQTTQDEYTAPKIVDHGDLQDLTAAGGGKFVDTPIGTPTPDITPGSTP